MTATDLQAHVDAHRGQARFAYRLAQECADRLLHVRGIGWHHWDGTRWAEAQHGEDTQAVLDTLKADYLASYTDKDLAADVRACQTASAVLGILRLAGDLKQFASTVDDLDLDPWLLNCANGTLDLRDLTLKDHDPHDKITRVCRAAYQPDATSAAWDQFLTQILPDPDVRAYLQRFVGVALLGAVREQEFTIAVGAGGNGKGVFYETVLHALGDYGHAAESDLFMTTKANANAASPAVMALRGRRFIVCSETERDHRLAAALMKNLTGGDPVTARGLHRDPITFTPTHTPLMVTNWLPKVAGNDPAVWRRMRVVPFDVTIPEKDRNPDLKHDLKLDAEAILAWAVRGWNDYQQQGMNPPAAVTAATDDYRRQSDAVTRFIAERLLVNPLMWVTAADLWEAWETWSRDEGAEPISKRDFSDEFDKRGWEAKNRKSNGRTVRARSGIGLASTDEEAD